MNKLINAVIGDNKKSSPARKYTAYALLGTLIVFLVLVIVLIASSVFFAVRGEGTPADGDDGPSGGNLVNTSGISYAAVTADVLDGKVNQDEIVKLADIRTKLSTGESHHYYAKNDKDGVENLTRQTATSLDKMMIAFYEKNKNNLVVDTDNENCNIPLILNTSADGYSFNVVRFNNDASIYNDANYKWIFDNAYSYGFVYTENTFTYVGVAVANYIRVTSSVTSYTQFLTAVKGANNNLNTSVKDTATNKSVSYQIYYLAKSGVLNVPTDYEYTVIPDGDNGYVITVNTSEPIIDGVG